MAADNKLDKVLREIGDHLGFLGYDADVQESEAGPYLWLKHLTSPNFIMKIDRGVVACHTRYEGSDMANSERGELVSLLNELNGHALTLRFYVDAQGRVYIETYFPHEYSKATFAAFWALVEADAKMIFDGRLAPFVQ
jgi:hypothetical protein